MAHYELFLEEFSPQQAQDLLDNHCDPVCVREAKSLAHRPKVEFYADIMRRGAWRTHPELFISFRDGRISDGHRRLVACVASGRPLKVYCERRVL
jgi:hypothetical protein